MAGGGLEGSPAVFVQLQECQRGLSSTYPEAEPEPTHHEPALLQLPLPRDSSRAE